MVLKILKCILQKNQINSVTYNVKEVPWNNISSKHFSTKPMRKLDTTSYRRILKISKSHENTKDLVLYGTQKSNTLVAEALKMKYNASFHKINENLVTQSFPTFCGITNISIIANALNIDPRKRWKGIWRWFDENNLHCINIDHIHVNGTNLDELAMIAKCNGIFTICFRPDTDEAKTKMNLINQIKNGNIIEERKLNRESHNNDEFKALKHNEYNYYCQEKNLISKEQISKKSNFYLFAICCILTSVRENIFCLLSYYRKAYNQTGTGHFGLSSLYHSLTKKILIRDVARFKYNSIWSSLEKAYSTLVPIDNQTNKPRGFLLCGKYF